MRVSLWFVLLLGGCDWAFGLSSVTADAMPDAPVPGRWSAAAVGRRHACAIDVDHHLYCWGDNGHGQLGTTAAITPTQVGSAAWSAIAAGGDHSCGISDGHAFCWGLDTSGQVDGTGGDDVLKPRLVPLPIGAPPLDEVTAGMYASCARGLGHVYCWGDPRVTGATSAAIEIGAATWKHVAAGFDQVCAIDGDDHAWCWGANDGGQLGIPASAQALPAQLATELLATDIAAGSRASCAILAGQVWCWGSGDVPAVDKAPPTRMIDGDDWTGIAVGTRSACASRASGTTCWGTAEHGGLGDGVWREVVAANGAQANLPAGAISLARGDRAEESGCELVGNDLTCWGDNRGGQLVAPATLHLTGKVIDHPDHLKWTALAAGSRHTCARDEHGALYCWGADDVAAVSGVPGADRPVPVAAGRASSDGELIAGTDFTCTRDGHTIACWGTNAHGELRVLDPTAHTSEADVDAATRLSSANGPAACDFGPRPFECWGLINGQPTFGPTSIAQGGSLFMTDYVAHFGRSSACALGADGHRVCWGQNYHAEFGDGSEAGGADPARPPTSIADGIVWLGMALSSEHACGIDSGKQLQCWGTNYNFESGQQVSDANDQIAKPDYVRDASGTPLGNCSKVALSPGASCVICNGVPLCWGANSRGELGRGTDTLDYRAVRVSLPGGSWGEIGTGDSHGCALAADGTIACWGLGDRGQIGDGSHGSARPVAIAHP